MLTSLKPGNNNPRDERLGWAPQSYVNPVHALARAAQHNASMSGNDPHADRDQVWIDAGTQYDARLVGTMAGVLDRFEAILLQKAASYSLMHTQAIHERLNTYLDAVCTGFEDGAMDATVFTGRIHPLLTDIFAHLLRETSCTLSTVMGDTSNVSVVVLAERAMVRLLQLVASWLQRELQSGGGLSPTVWTTVIASTQWYSVLCRASNLYAMFGRYLRMIHDERTHTGISAAILATYVRSQEYLDISVQSGEASGIQHTLMLDCTTNTLALLEYIRSRPDATFAIDDCCGSAVLDDSNVQPSQLTELLATMENLPQLAFMPNSNTIHWSQQEHDVRQLMRECGHTGDVTVLLQRWKTLAGDYERTLLSDSAHAHVARLSEHGLTREQRQSIIEAFEATVVPLETLMLAALIETGHYDRVPVDGEDERTVQCTSATTAMDCAPYTGDGFIMKPSELVPARGKLPSSMSRLPTPSALMMPRAMNAFVHSSLTRRQAEELLRQAIFRITKPAVTTNVLPNGAHMTVGVPTTDLATRPNGLIESFTRYFTAVRRRLYLTYTLAAQDAAPPAPGLPALRGREILPAARSPEERLAQLNQPAQSPPQSLADAISVVLFGTIFDQRTCTDNQETVAVVHELAAAHFALTMLLVQAVAPPYSVL